ncbi:MAG TPA: nitroreductase/quinone reductase family protein [Acidimicrobiales bacterium]|nr:nitroreductase/quinone reductase family protein [Acidimicrobiales bacterium]
MKPPEWLYQRLARGVPALHRSLWHLTRGRLGWRLGGVEFCLLKTTGRRSNRPRTTPLVLIRGASHLFLVASNGGSDHHPDWYLNLVKHPSVTLETREGRVTRSARTATETERSLLWGEAERVYVGYGTYQQKTKRVIPIVLLDETQ